MIVDTHVHCWDLKKAEYTWLQDDTSVLNQTWKLEQLEDERKKAGVTKGVLVQAAGNMEDTRLMFETAARTDWIKGIVAWLPLLNPDRSRQLLDEKFLAAKYFKGVRHQIHDEPDPGWLLQPAVIDSLKLLAAHDIPYDVVGVLPAHLITVLEVAEKVPGLRMVLDHLNQPPIAKGERFGEWGRLMIEAAKHKNIFAKISGLRTASGDFANRQPADIKPYIEFSLEHFGIDRCFCGGDWPVSELAGNYSSTWQMYKSILSELLSKEDQEKVFYHNAMQFYNLG
jgi:L-fuconolactonase